MNSMTDEKSRPQSPVESPAASPERAPSRQRRGRSRTPRSQSISSEASVDAPPQRQRRRRGQGGKQGGPLGGGGLPAVGEVDDVGMYLVLIEQYRVTDADLLCSYLHRQHRWADCRRCWKDCWRHYQGPRRSYGRWR